MNQFGILIHAAWPFDNPDVTHHVEPERHGFVACCSKLSVRDVDETAIAHIAWRPFIRKRHTTLAPLIVDASRRLSAIAARNRFDNV